MFNVIARPLCFFAMLSVAGACGAAEIEVRSANALGPAINAANPGDVITLAPGRYEVGKIRIDRPGTEDRPITLRAAKLGTVRIEPKRIVGFEVRAAHWHFENLDVIGQCEVKNHSACEHAFHIIGDADGVEIRSSRLVNFNAAIKANGRPNAVGRDFPDDVVVSDSFIYNTTPRNTRNPVVAIDVVGGRRWQIIDNFLADYGRVDGIASYQGFLKGHSIDGVMARNLVLCNWRHEGRGRVGLSLGGGGVPDSTAEFCEDGLCKVEHVNGQVIGNIVANCPTEPGLYLNAAENTRVAGNLFFQTTGIQLHTQYASADVEGNILNGGIRDRQGSSHAAAHNVIYGSHYGSFLPSVSAYVVRRLEGQDKKFPSLISAEMVQSVQGFVERVVAIIASTSLGLGTASMEDIVVDAASHNLALREPNDFSQAGVAFVAQDLDFCGRARGTDSTAGAMIAAEAPCKVSARIQSALEIERASPVN